MLGRRNVHDRVASIQAMSRAGVAVAIEVAVALFVVRLVRCDAINAKLQLSHAIIS
jgi:hypothetical protein